MLHTLAVCLAFLCALGCAQMDDDLTSVQPVQYWSEPATSGAQAPQSMAVFPSLGIVVSWRDSLVLVAYNISNGQTIWQMAMSSCAPPSLVVAQLPMTLLLVCGTGGFVMATDSGAAMGTFQLPQQLQLAPMSEPDVDGGNDIYAQSSPLTSVVILSISNKTSGSVGTIAYSVTTKSLSQVVYCDVAQGVARLAFFATSFLQVCSDGTVLNAQYDGTLKWATPNPELSGCVATPYTSPQTMQATGIVTVCGNITTSVVSVYSAGSATPLWTSLINTPVRIVQVVQPSGPFIIARTSDVAYTLAADTGASLCRTSGDFEQLGIAGLIVSPQNTSFFVIVPKYSATVSVIDAATCLNISLVDATNGNVFTDSPVYFVEVMLSSAYVPMDSNNPTVSDSFPAVAVWSGSDTVFFLGWNDMVAYGSAIVDGSNINGSPQFVANLFVGESSVAAEGGLVLPLQYGVAVLSLATGWVVPVDSSSAPVVVDAIVYFTLEDQTLAYDRTGTRVWFGPTLGAGPMNVFGNNVLITIGPDSTQIAFYDALTGSQIRTSLIPSACHDEQTINQPEIIGIVTDVTNQIAFFSSGQSCVFRIDSALFVYPYSAGVPAINSPVVDSDNGLVYLAYVNVVVAMKITGGQVWTFQHTSNIEEILLSSQNVPASTLGQGNYPYIFIVSGSDVVCLDVQAAPDNLFVWSTTPANSGDTFIPGGAIFYNVSIFAGLTGGSLCRISTLPQTPELNRVMWCTNINLDSGTGSVVIAPSAGGSIFVSPLLAYDNSVYRVDVDSGYINWKLSADSISAILLDADHYILFVASEMGLMAIDAVIGTQLFTVGINSINNLYYFSNTIFVSAEDGVHCFTIPHQWRSLQPMPSVPIQPPASATLPPGYVPQTPVPTVLPPYPQLPTPIDPRPVLLDTVDSYAGATITSYLAPGFMWTTPLSNGSGSSCIVQGLNVTAASLPVIWSAPFPSTACGCMTPLLMVMTDATAATVLVVSCALTATAAYRAETGQLLWQSNQSSTWRPVTYFQCTTGSIIVGFDGTKNIVGVNPTTGQLVWNQTMSSTMLVLGSDPVDFLMYYPATTPYAGVLLIVGKNLQASLVSAVSVSLTTAAELPPNTIPASCSNSRVQPALVNRALQSMVEQVYTDTAYVACTGTSSTSSDFPIFSLQVLTGDVALLSTLTISSSGTAILQSVVLDRLASAAPLMYVDLGDVVVAFDVYAKTVLKTLKFPLLEGGFDSAVGALDDVLLVSGSNTLFGFSIASGTLMWNVSTTIGLSGYEGRRFAVEYEGIGRDVILVGGEVLLAVHNTTGDLVWATSRGSSCNTQSITVITSTTLWSPTSPSGGAIVVVTGANLPGYKVAGAQLFTQFDNPSWNRPAENLVVFTEDGFFAAIVSYQNVVAKIDQTNTIEWSFFLGNSNTYSIQLISVVAISNIKVVVIVVASFVTILDALTGAVLAQVSLAAACPQSTSDQSVQPTVIAVASYIFLYDAQCVYRIERYSPTSYGISGVPVDGVDNNNPRSPTIALSSDNSTLIVYGTMGVTGIDTASVSVMWVQDFSAQLGLDVETILATNSGLLCSDDFFIVALEMHAVMALRCTDGSLLWLEYNSSILTSTFTSAYIAPDFTLVVLYGQHLVRYSLDVNTTQRVLWVVAFSTEPSSATQFPGSSVIVTISVTSMQGIDLATGSQLWRSTNGDSDFCGTSSPPVSAGIGGVPSIFFNPACGVTAWSLASGQRLYSLGIMPTYAPQVFVAGDSFVAFDPDAALVEYRNYVLDSGLPLPPASSSAPVPTIPSGYAYTTPTPSALPAPTSYAIPSSITMWTLQPSSDGSLEQFIFPVTLSPSSVIAVALRLVGSSYTLIGFDCATGNQFFNQNLSTGECNAAWLGQMNSAVGAYYCQVNSTLVLFNLSSSVLATFATILLPMVPPFEVLQIDELGYTCLINHDMTGMNCISVVPNQPNFGKVVYSYSGDTFSMNPVYSSSSKTIFLSCQTAGLVALNAATGVSVWSNTTLRVTSNNNFAICENFAAILLVGDSQTYFVVVVEQSNGVQVMPDFVVDSNVFSSVTSIALIQQSQYQVVIVVQGDSCVGVYQWPGGHNVYLFNGPVSAITTGIDAVTGNQSLYFYDDGTGSFVGVDAVTGQQLYSFSIGAGGPFFEQATVTNNGLGVVYNTLASFYNFLVYVDNAARRISLGYEFSSVYSSGTSALTSLALNGEQFFLVSDGDGEVAFCLYNKSTLALTANTYFEKETALPEFNILISTYGGRTTVAQPSTGSITWTTNVDLLPSQITDETIQPAAFLNVNGANIGIVGLTTESFVVHDLSTGGVRAINQFPSCGKIPSAAGMTFSVVDSQNQRLIASIGNLCVYAIAAVSGAVLAAPLPGATAIATPLVLASPCVVAVNTFGTILCLSQDYLAGKTTTGSVIWTYETGYAEGISVDVYGSFVIAAIYDSIYCLTLTDGQLVWTTSVGRYIGFTTFSGFLLVVSDIGAYCFTLDPAVPISERPIWSVSADQFGTFPFQNQLRAKPFVSASGIFVFEIRGHISALNYFTGQQVFIDNSPETQCTQIYNRAGIANAPILDSVFVASCSDVSLRSVLTGKRVFTLQSPAGAQSWIDSMGHIVFHVDSVVQSTELPIGLLTLLVPSAGAAVPTNPPPSGPLPSGFTPQGLFTGVPTLPPGVILPKLSCVTNIEAMYNSLVVCINSALGTIYSTAGLKNCTRAAQTLSPCVNTWINGILPDCLGAAIYLNSVLSQLNSSAFNFCGNPQLCSDSAAGSDAACSAINAAQSLTNGATQYPDFTLPLPAGNMPNFTQPPNSAQPAPVTNLPVTSTVAPSGPVTPGTTAIPATTSSAQPQTSANPGTSTPTAPPPVITTFAVPTTGAPSASYRFTCTVKTGLPCPPPLKQLRDELQQLMTLDSSPQVSIVSSSLLELGNSFQFQFSDPVLSEALSMQLVSLISSQLPQVLSALQLTSITFAPFTPAAASPSPPAKHFSDGEIAGIIVGGVLLLGLGTFVLYSKRKNAFGSPRRAASLLQSDLELTSESNSLMRRQGAGPIYASL